MARAKGLSRRSKIFPFTSHFTDVAGLFFLLLVSSAAQGKGKHYVYGLHLLLSYLASRVGKELVWRMQVSLHHHKARKQMCGSG